MRRGFHVDLAGCIGCKACQVACKDKHGLGPGLRWRRVVEVAGGKWELRDSIWRDESYAYFMSVACCHCARPICAEVCPTKALTKRDDGIVWIDAGRCMGCRYCEWACPYGAPQFDAESGVMTKCDLCRDHLEQGRDPACVEACPTRVLSLVDLEDGAEGESAVFPLPPADLTEPTTTLSPHRDVARAADAKPTIGNREEI